MVGEFKIFDAHMHHIGRFKPRNETLISFIDRYGIDKACVTTLYQEANLDTILKFNENIEESELLKNFLRTE